MQHRNAAIDMRINGEFPVFAHGTGHALSFFDSFGFDEGGMREMWRKFRTLETNLRNFLSTKFPELRESVRRAICELKLANIKEAIDQKDRSFRECLRVSRIKRGSGL